MLAPVDPRGGRVCFQRHSRERRHSALRSKQQCSHNHSSSSHSTANISPLVQGNVFVWQLFQANDRTQLIPLTHFSAHKEYITRVLLSPDVKKLATCSADHTAKIWEVKDMEPIPHKDEPKPFPLEATLTGHQRWVWDCAFSADSAYLVTACSDHYARLWELHSQQIIRQYNGHHRGAVCVALNDYSEAR